MTTAPFSLKNFRLEQIKFPTRIVIIGPSGSGKTKVGLDILHHFRKKIFTAILVSSSEHERERDEQDFYGIIPDIFQFHEFDEKILKKIF
jgi:ABC-type dipeptide/oligopeptide/nickel transport system ATPase subunit